MTRMPTPARTGETVRSADNRAVLAEPFCGWSGADILRHFQTRSTVSYFAVVDEEQAGRQKVDAILANRFEFNGQTFRLPAPIEWCCNPSQDIEWIILLHKFYYAAGLGQAYADTGDSRYVSKWVELIDSWIQSVPKSFLSSDVMGRRVQNWVFSQYFFVSGRTAPICPEFYLRFLRSLHDQVAHLCQHLTPARNHRTIELYAVFLVAVVFPEFRRAAEWLEFSLRELARNIRADFLADGVHCELSTDYHHLVLKNYLGIKKLANLNQTPLPPAIDVGIRGALEFSLFAHKPDGWVPALSDGDSRCFLGLLQQGHELYHDERWQFAATQGGTGTRPQERSRAFSASGYYVLRSGWGDARPYVDEQYMIIDCGPLGAGNHGHLDALSFELAACGRSLVVDPGRYTYNERGETNWRARFRGTAYHNTVVVDSRNQTRYESDGERFRILGPAPECQVRAFASGADWDYFHGTARSHEYEVVHERRIFFAAPQYWIVSDFLTGTQDHDYDLVFHLSDTAWQRVAISQDSGISVDSPNLLLVQPPQPGVTVAIDDGFVSQRYGQRQAAPIVRFSQRNQRAVFHTVLFPYGDSKPQVIVESLCVATDDGSVATGDACALRIEVTRGLERWVDYYFSQPPETPSDAPRRVLGCAGWPRGMWGADEFPPREACLLVSCNMAAESSATRRYSDAFAPGALATGSRYP